jgi:hypothetical protein
VNRPLGLALLLSGMVGAASGGGLGCGKPSSSAGAASQAADAATAVKDGGPVEAIPSEDPLLTDLWKRALEGDADDHARLCERIGSDGLIEATAVPARRLTALRALAFATDFTALPFVAKVAGSGTDDEAAAALESASFELSQPRRAEDRDDALEIAEGSAALLAVAKDKKVAVARRTRVVRVLRQLADRGWVVPAEVPTDLDAH